MLRSYDFYSHVILLSWKETFSLSLSFYLFQVHCNLYIYGKDVKKRNTRKVNY